MTKGVKIAVGCFVALLAVAVIASVGMGVGLYWLKGWVKGKAEPYTTKMSETANDLDKYSKQANANPFTRPSDGAFTEDRLLKFLEVRKQVYNVYETHRADFENAKGKKEADLGDVLRFGGLVAEIKVAQEKAQAEVGMSDDEYLFMVQGVYGAAMNSTLQKETGKTASQTFDEALEQSKRAIRDAAKQAGANSAADQSKIQESEGQIDEAKRSLTAVGSPQSNIDLYRKHEAEIQKYAMQGLALLGL